MTRADTRGDRSQRVEGHSDPRRDGVSARLLASIANGAAERARASAPRTRDMGRNLGGARECRGRTHWSRPRSPADRGFAAVRADHGHRGPGHQPRRIADRGRGTPRRWPAGSRHSSDAPRQRGRSRAATSSFFLFGCVHASLRRRVGHSRTGRRQCPCERCVSHRTVRAITPSRSIGSPDGITREHRRRGSLQREGTTGVIPGVVRSRPGQFAQSAGTVSRPQWPKFGASGDGGEDVVFTGRGGRRGLR
jgi:hypothetical protein